MSFGKINGLDVVDNKWVVTDSWSKDRLRRVVNYLNTNHLPIDNANDLLQSVHSFTLSHSIFTRSTIQKVEFELFKCLVKAFFSDPLSDSELKLLYKFIFGLKTCNFQTLQQISQKHSKDELFELLDQIGLIIRANESLIDHIKALEVVVKSDRENVIAFIKALKIHNDSHRLGMLKVIKDIPEQDRSLSNLSKFYNRCKGLEKINFDSIAIAILTIDQNKRANALFNANHLFNSFHNYFKRDGSNVGDVLKLISHYNQVTILDIKRCYNSSALFFASFHALHFEFDTYPFLKVLSRIAEKDLTNDVISATGSMFLDYNKIPDFVDILNPEHLGGAILCLASNWLKIKTTGSVEYYLRPISLIEKEKRTPETISKLINYINTSLTLPTIQRVLNVFERIPNHQRHPDLLNTIELFVEIEESYNKLMGILPNELVELLNISSFLVITRCIQNFGHRNVVMKYVLENPSEAEEKADQIRVCEQVQIAEQLYVMGEENDTVDQLLRSFLSEFELYIPELSHQLLKVCSDRYPKEIHEIAESRFKDLSLEFKQDLMILMSPEQIKQLLTESDVEKIFATPITIKGQQFPLIEAFKSDSHYKSNLGSFCLVAMKKPELIYPHLLKTPSETTPFFFKFLEIEKFPEVIVSIQDQASELEFFASRLLLKSKNGVPVYRVLSDMQMLNHIFIKTLDYLKTELNARNLNLDIQCLFDQSKKLTELLTNLELSEINNIPKDFLDPLTLQIMKNPVKLPKRDNTFVDLSTLRDTGYFQVEVRSGITYRKNPFSTEYHPDYTESEIEQTEPGYVLDPDLRKKIENIYNKRS